MKKAACAAFFVVLKHCMRSATERTSATTTAAPTATATITTTTTTTSALAATASRQAVDAGACRVRLATGGVAAARLIAARGKLVGHQRVDVARQFVAIATRATLTAGWALAWGTVVASVVKAAFWAWAVVAVAFKTRGIATEFAIATSAALWAATS
jgi:hypothetical protein